MQKMCLLVLAVHRETLCNRTCISYSYIQRVLVWSICDRLYTKVLSVSPGVLFRSVGSHSFEFSFGMKFLKDTKKEGGRGERTRVLKPTSMWTSTFSCHMACAWLYSVYSVPVKILLAVAGSFIWSSSALAAIFLFFFSFLENRYT